MSRDDSSSVSSANTSGRCKTCRELETLPSKPLIKCPFCNVKRWHAHCHVPPIDPRQIPKDWKCKACCSKDTKTAPGLSRPAPSSSFPSEPSINIRGNLCKEHGCTRPVFQSNSPLCQYHKIQQQHKKATAMKSVPALNAASGSKPIKKKSLYNFKPDDATKSLLNNKRKRSTPTKRNSSDIAVPAAASSSAAKLPQNSPSQGARASVTSAPATSTPMRTPQQRAAQFNLLAGMGSDRSPFDDNLSRSLGSASMAESPISLRDADLDVLTPHSAHRTAQNMYPLTSPEYSPPPPVQLSPKEANDLWAEPDRDDSPGSQIHQELQATADMTDDLEFTGSPEQQLSPVIAALTSIQGHKEREDQPDKVDTNADVLHPEDEEMPDAHVLFEEDSFPKAIDASAMVSSSPAITSVSSSTTPDEDIIYDADMDEDSPVPELPQSLETKRKQTAATFDTSELDSFLAMQAEAEPDDLQATPQELANTQMWGHIDPTKVWPKENSEEWLAEKRQEIDARGGRKANFGKHLTSQLRKERAAKGWDIHQNSETLSEEKLNNFRETARHMEELFGIKGIDDLVPGVRDGQLVVMEKPYDENGRKKRKVKVYPV